MEGHILVRPGSGFLHSARFLVQEIFGPVLAVYVYPEKDYEEVLQLIDNTSPYALTGAVFAQDQ